MDQSNLNRDPLLTPKEKVQWKIGMQVKYRILNLIPVNRVEIVNWKGKTVRGTMTAQIHDRL